MTNSTNRASPALCSFSLICQHCHHLLAASKGVGGAKDCLLMHKDAIVGYTDMGGKEHRFMTLAQQVAVWQCGREECRFGEGRFTGVAISGARVKDEGHTRQSHLPPSHTRE
ncbi:hypothetical protein E2562_028085 [Oryza meyeriana var. granulata]|uniref:Uncharacterized protein n=1 Tax=Oryza meyeriana var. granulata TaxID=110450 RepID=A0A6G1BZU1_9ORYZ|nr:hypothetical protein E2562_028085 [Oryza meyeriana var. granulata]